MVSVDVATLNDIVLTDPNDDQVKAQTNSPKHLLPPPLTKHRGG